jgi:hypothetical protein
MHHLLQVAIKKINSVFENPIVAWRTLREVHVMLHGTARNSCNPDLPV